MNGKGIKGNEWHSAYHLTLGPAGRGNFYEAEALNIDTERKVIQCKYSKSLKCVTLTPPTPTILRSISGLCFSLLNVMISGICFSLLNPRPSSPGGPVL
jgi:hypothetical protein